MYQNEQKGEADFPSRFLPWIKEKAVFESTDPIRGVFTVGTAQKRIFLEMFPNYPEGKVAVVPNGYNQHIFHPIKGLTKGKLFENGLGPKFYDGFDSSKLDKEVKDSLGFEGNKPPSCVPADKFDKLVQQKKPW